MKFSDKKVRLLVSLITRRPPPSPQDVRLVSTVLSILIACNSLIAQPQLEKAATAWIRWLLKGRRVRSECKILTFLFSELSVSRLGMLLFMDDRGRLDCKICFFIPDYNLYFN